MKVCAISGRHSQSGRRTKHPHSGPWAHRAPAKMRKYDVNLQTVTVPLPNGQKKKIKIAARMLTSRKFQAILDGRQPLPTFVSTSARR